MNKYIKVFDTHTEYEAYSGDDMIFPNVSYCKNDNDVHYNPLLSQSERYLTFVALEDGTFQFSKNAVNYSLDNGNTWTELAANTDSPTVTAGNKIMWKASLTPTTTGIGTFSSTAQFDVEGNPMSLLYGDDFKEKTDLTGKDYAFYRLFSDCTNVVSAKNMSLSATTLASSCYYCMFQGCTSLTTAPELPATTLASSCYDNMFSGCTSLITTPALPATTLANYCYDYMFHNCKSLTTAPVLSATTLASSCYYGMFQGCTNLTTAPELPATTLASSCYSNMFRDCTSLTRAPELPTTTLENGCYNSMFYGCTKLNYIKAMFTTTPSDTYTSYWVRSVASSGTFVKNSAATWDVTGTSGIPSGWTVETASA